MNATNMQVIENIAEHLWEVTYSGNDYLYIAKTAQITLKSYKCGKIVLSIKKLSTMR